MNSSKFTEINILNIPIHPMERDQLISQVDQYIHSFENEVRLIGYVNMHGLYVAIKNSNMLHFYKTSNLNYVDGMPIVLIGKLFGYKLNANHRTTFLDFVFEFLNHCKSKDYKVAWIGGDQESMSKGLAIIKSKLTGIQILGIDGFQTEQSYITQINRFQPDLIFLGLGMPRQEEFALRIKDKLDTKLIWTIGATIDYISGKVYMPPSWAGKFCLEWFFRFLSEPKRMFFRYFIEPFLIGYHLIFKRKV